MGTVVTFDVRSSAATHVVSELFEVVAKLLVALDEDFGDGSNSWTSRLDPGEVDPAGKPRSVDEVMRLCEEVSHRTGHRLTARWRGDGTANPRGVLRGWAAQQVSDLFLERGFPDHCVNAAGDVVLSGYPADGLRWRVGVADPREEGALLGFVDGTGSLGEFHFGRAGARWAVATSVAAQRAPRVPGSRTGLPAAGSLSATVIGRLGGYTAGYAAAVVAARGSPELMHDLHGLGCPAIVLAADGSIEDPFGYLHPLPT